MRTSQAEQETACLHPAIEAAMLTWLETRSHPAFLLIGCPGVGKTTMVYRICKIAKYWIQEFNASHTRTGSSFRQTILPLLTEKGISALIHPSTPNGRAILLDEMDGLSQGEKGGLQELLDYLKSKRNFKEDAPLFLICNVMEGRVMQQLLKHCLVQQVGMPAKEHLDSFYKVSVAESLYRLGDLRKVSQGLVCGVTKDAYEQSNQDAVDKNIHIAIRAAWFTLFERWGLNDELDLETKDANLAGLLFHQNLPLFLEHAPFELYETILQYIRWSDRADFWAFFHQCWNLLPLSYNLKLKYPNHILKDIPLPSHVPSPDELVYTQVLTKQSALFNSWKEMNRVSNEQGVPFRCVTQWATHQTGKLKDTLGLPIGLPTTATTTAATNKIIQPITATATVATAATVTAAATVATVATVAKPRAKAIPRTTSALPLSDPLVSAPSSQLNIGAQTAPRKKSTSKSKSSALPSTV